MWWFVDVAWAGPFDGRWQVARSEIVGAPCAPVPRLDEPVAITDGAVRVGTWDLRGSVAGDALVAAGLVGREPETQRWELRRQGDELVGNVRVGDGCITTLTVALVPQRTTELWWAVDPPIAFMTGKALFAEGAEAALTTVLDKIGDQPSVVVEIAVHTDSQGSDVFNQKLSQQRAEAVRDWLVAHGVPAPRLTARGYGELLPVGDNTTTEGRLQNRRIELRVPGGP
jgi:outer membrane protein OmpA-like peptidoglycan-associated protein